VLFRLPSLAEGSMAKTTTKKRGRPKGSVAEQTREKHIQIKVFPDEKRAYEEAALSEGLNVSSWIRQQLNRIVKTQGSK
jgi:hypothetical protein